MNLFEQRENIRLKRDREQKRRQGHNFIRVINTVYPRYDRLHSVDDVELYEVEDAEKGGTKDDSRPCCRAIEFIQDEITLDWVADVLDTERNQFFLARHLNLGIEIEDAKMREKIEALVDKEYKVELTKKEEKKRKVRELNREIRKLEDEEAKDEKEKTSMKNTNGVIRDRKVKEKNQEESLKIPGNTEEGI